MFKRVARTLAITASAATLFGLGMALAPQSAPMAMYHHGHRVSAQLMDAMATQTLTRAQVNSLPNLAGCFGHHGVQLSTHVAYECIDQSVSGGALYWSQNLNNENWDKHPASGLDWVEASTIHPNANSNPPTSFQAFWVGIGHNKNFCTVVNPGAGQHPTQCEIAGVIHTMTSKQQASYDAFIKAIESVTPAIPDCAYSMTEVSKACDIES